MRRALVTLAAALALAGLAPPARGGDAPLPVPDSTALEPPPEAPEGEDFEIERADSLADESLEIGLAATGRPGEAPRARRRVRYRDGELSAQVREGAGDPLAGATLDTRAAGGTLRIGRLAPRWGRGLVLGSAGAPWSRAALDRGDGARFRGRAGDGAWLRLGGGPGVEALAARFGRRDLGGVRLAARGASVGLVGARGGEHQWSLALARRGGEGEIAVDRSGRWRAEAGAVRRLGRAALAGQARGGIDGFRSLAEPERSGPAEAAAVSLDSQQGRAALRAIGALWRFRPGLAGTRGALEVSLRFAQHGNFALGLEEQQGARRIPSSARAAPSRLRRGIWSEWRGGPPGFLLALRHEAWGEDRLARHAVRVVSAARLEARGPFGASLGVAHTVYHARRGESLYLAEAESDRLVLRALAGDGERTRLEVRAPLGGGTSRAALDLASAAGKHPRLRWTLDWTRRAGARRSGRAP
ncbi:MAG TPA: hypothetical protein VGK89_04120 [Candidatus Eisenbacteria bacterium]